MIIYPEDRVLIAIMNNVKDWATVQEEGWYRIPVKKAPQDVLHSTWLAFYFTSKFGADKWAIHYYARILGHEMVSRADLMPHQPNHPRAGNWYYKLMLGPLRHKMPPIISNKWRRITFINTTGDRFENALEINDLFNTESPIGRLYVTLKEKGYQVEQYWTIKEKNTLYQADLVVGKADGWQPINLNAHPHPHPKTLQLSEGDSLESYVEQIKMLIDKSK